MRYQARIGFVPRGGYFCDAGYASEKCAFARNQRQNIKKRSTFRAGKEVIAINAHLAQCYRLSH